MSSAVAVAWTSSTARAAMLQYGFVRDLVGQAEARQRRRGPRVQLIGVERDPGRRPEQVRPAVAAAGLERVVTTATCCSSNIDSQSVAAMSRPSFETIRPWFIGYSVGWRRGRRAAARARTPAARGRATRSTVASREIEGLHEVRAERRELGAPDRRARTRRRGRDTGWMARPPISATIAVAGSA